MGGELREIIGFIQAGIGEVVHTTIDQIVKFRHQVVQGTTTNHPI